MIVHIVHHPVGAKTFIEPAVEYLQRHGLPSELWTESLPGKESFIAAMRVTHRVVACDVRLNPLAVVRTIRQLRLLMRKSQVKIVHCHQTRSSLLPLVAAWLEKVPVRVYHNHGISYVASSGLRKISQLLVERLNLRLATHRLFVSHSTLDRARRDGLLAQKDGIVPGPGSIAGIDLNEFPASLASAESRRRTRLALNLPADGLIIGYVGRPVGHKGFPQILDVWDKTGLAQNGGLLIMAGISSKVAQQSGASNLGVKAMGYLSDMPSFYSACDVVCLPSRTEGFPYVLLEAGACGRPAVAYDVLGNSDAICHESTGLLVPEGESMRMADALKRLALDHELRRKMGESARLRVENEFSRDKVLGALLDYYRSDLLPPATGRRSREKSGKTLMKGQLF